MLDQHYGMVLAFAMLFVQVEGATRCAAKELAPRKITVNAVSPGPVSTELFFAGKSAEVIAKQIAICPMGRLGEPGDIAPIVSFLARDESGWVSGQIIGANGGTA